MRRIGTEDCHDLDEKEVEGRVTNEVETDEEIEEHLVIQEASDCSIPEEVVEVKDDDIDYSKFVIFY